MRHLFSANDIVGQATRSSRNVLNYLNSVKPKPACPGCPLKFEMHGSSRPLLQPIALPKERTFVYSGAVKLRGDVSIHVPPAAGRNFGATVNVASGTLDRRMPRK